MDRTPDKIGDTILNDLSPHLETVTLDAGATLFHQGDTGDDVYIVGTGQLVVTVKLEDGSDLQVGVIDPGELAGEIQFLSGGKRTANVRAACRTDLLRLSKSSFENLAPHAVEQLYKMMRQRLCRNQLAIILQKLFGTTSPTLLKEVHRHLQWHHLQRGETLFHQGDWGESLYIVVSGRLQVVAEDEDEGTRIVAERARGDIIGEMALLLGGYRSATVRCIRDSDLVSISKDVIEGLVDEYPQVVLALTRMLAKRMQQGMHVSRKKRTEMNIAVVAAHPGAPLSEFSERLGAALAELVPTLHLNSRKLDSLFRIESISQVSDDNPYRMNLSIWLDEQETKYELILYEADMSLSSWTTRCMKQADHIILAARASECRQIDENSAAIFNHAGDPGSTGRTLVMLHSGGSPLPNGTRHCLDMLKAANHHHLDGETDAQYRRLARILAGKAVGLVLSGGGACGFAHIGVIKALEEAGVPIDLIGGTSMGAAVAAQYAMGICCEDLVRLAKKMFVDSKPFQDFTIPFISFIRSRKFDDALRKLYGETMIEDLWLNFFCISTSLTSAKAVIHDHGSLCRAVRASTALPGIVTPVIQGNEVLVDGGVLNNLPVDVMQELWDCFTIGVNASGGSDDFIVEREEVPSPMEIIRGFVNPSSGRVQFPNLFNILSRTSTVSSVHKTNFASKAADLFLRPPVSGLGLLDFAAIDRIVAIGYEYSKEKVRQWKEKFSVG